MSHLQGITLLYSRAESIDVHSCQCAVDNKVLLLIVRPLPILHVHIFDMRFHVFNNEYAFIWVVSVYPIFQQLSELWKLE